MCPTEWKIKNCYILKHQIFTTFTHLKQPFLLSLFLVPSAVQYSLSFVFLLIKPDTLSRLWQGSDYPTRFGYIRETKIYFCLLSLSLQRQLCSVNLWNLFCCYQKLQVYRFYCISLNVRQFLNAPVCAQYILSIYVVFRLNLILACSFPRCITFSISWKKVYNKKWTKKTWVDILYLMIWKVTLKSRYGYC